ncbi:hypothetical protein AB6A40_001659 [Gnathostoma spinigerum]|uniref:Uncharacterized protein n=1 Tax=Gnathostoma spinigerum TaxID=75299 RepID=A0ABD6E5P3_9BILA
MNDLEKYRPKNIYKEEPIAVQRPQYADRDFPWESHYQIGPETFLLATRGPEFNARVRDYRRELFGEAAPYVMGGFLGFRNQDITVRERRRFTDLIREDPTIAESVENLNRDMRKSHNGAIRRIRSDISKLAPVATRKNTDGTFGAIFKKRLRDVAFLEGANMVTFECTVIGSPQPNVTWYHFESAITNDGKYTISRDNEICHLQIRSPTLAEVGEYSCTASNEHGSDRTSASLMTGDAPAPPGRPEIELASDTEVYITWETPLTSTGLECFTYKLEQRNAGENDFFAEWLLVSDSVDEEAAVVRNLNPQGIYQFRVTAKNAFGWGKPSLISRTIQTNPKNTPKLPIPLLQQQRHLCVLNKPAKSVRRGRTLGEIIEEDEEEEGEEDGERPTSALDGQTIVPEAITVNTSDNPLLRYKITSELFCGRFGIILGAIDTKIGSSAHRAIKITKASDAQREFDNLKTCQNENVAQIYAAYQRKNIFFIVLEELSEDIFQRFTYPESYNEEQVARSIAQLAAALHWIHFKGIAHMDIQPSNVMFTSRRSWQIKLIDFGSALAIGIDSRKPDTELNVYWAAPEMYQISQPPTVQSDIWGLGLISFCLLSGFHPFASEGDTDQEIRDCVLNERCNPNLIQMQASEESLRFVTWALKKDPLRRMRTDEALTHRWLNNATVMVRRRTNIKYASSRLRRTAVLTAALSAELDPSIVSLLSETKR